MKRKTLIRLLVALGILIILLVVGKKMGWFGENTDAKKVEVATIEPITITETVAATGKIQPETEVKLSSEVSGEIIKLNVVEGQRVKKGDLLVRVNPDLYQSAVRRSQATLENARANYAQTQAQLTEAEANYERNKTLFERGVISKAEWDQFTSAYESAKAGSQSAFHNIESAAATVSEARDNMARTTIYAPMDGIVSRLDAELGERVVGTQQMAGTEIMRLANLNSMEVLVDVNENDIIKVSLADSAKVEVDAYLNREFRGIVTEIANSPEEALSADQVTNFKVKVRILPESYEDLLEGKPENFSPFRSGMTAMVDIITQKKTDIVGVPISAIVVRSDTTATATPAGASASSERYECVFVKDGEHARLRVVKTGIQDDTNIEITSGLELDEEVITGPYNTITRSLEPDDKVSVNEKAKDKSEK